MKDKPLHTKDIISARMFSSEHLVVNKIPVGVMNISISSVAVNQSKTHSKQTYKNTLELNEINKSGFIPVPDRSV